MTAQQQLEADEKWYREYIAVLKMQIREIFPANKAKSQTRRKKS